MQWLHYVGERNYTPAEFIKEAKAIGISRRAPANQVGAMHFGDTVLLLTWRGGKPAVFGEFRISRVIFQGEVNAKLKDQLQSEGKIVADNSGAAPVQVKRKCGSYWMGGGCTVRDDVDIPELIEDAEKIHAELLKGEGVPEGETGSLWVMVGGDLTKEYFPPRTLDPAPSFTRGFMRTPDGTHFVDANPTDTGIPTGAPAIVGVEEYQGAMG